MNKVCVVTGGGSGIGLATARRMMKKGYYVILTGRTKQKLENAVRELEASGGQAEAFACDVSNKTEVAALVERAKQCGKVMVVVHIAGASPHMGSAEEILATNAMGTIYINNAFYECLETGGCIIDTSSMSAALAPSFLMPRRQYRYSATDPQRFFQKMITRINLFPKKLRSSMAYVFSKDFVTWFAKQDAARFGAKGVRVLSITPGNFDTPMGDAEKEEAQTYLQFNAIKRLGKADEIAALYEAVSDESMGYLTGANIICDGGCLASGATAFSR